MRINLAFAYADFSADHRIGGDAGGGRDRERGRETGIGGRFEEEESGHKRWCLTICRLGESQSVFYSRFSLSRLPCLLSLSLSFCTIIFCNRTLGASCFIRFCLNLKWTIWEIIIHWILSCSFMTLKFLVGSHPVTCRILQVSTL